MRSKFMSPVNLKPNRFLRVIAQEKSIVGALAKIMLVENGSIRRPTGDSNVFVTVASLMSLDGRSVSPRGARSAVDRLEERLAQFNANLYRVRRSTTSPRIDVLTLKHDLNIWVDGGNVWPAWKSHWYHRLKGIHQRHAANAPALARTARAEPELSHQLAALQTTSLDKLLPQPPSV